MKKKYYNFDRLPIGTIVKFEDGVEGIITSGADGKTQRNNKSLYILSYGTDKTYDVWIHWSNGYILNADNTGFRIIDIRKPFKRK